MFSNFNPVNASEWWNQVIKDLKGASPATLNIEIERGLDVKPFYTKEAVSAMEYIEIYAASNQWKIGDTVHVEDEKEANLLALNLLNGGAEAILFVINSPKNLSILLENIQLEYISTHFGGNYIADNPLDFLSDFEKITSNKNISGSFQVPSPSKEFIDKSTAAFPIFKNRIIFTKTTTAGHYSDELLYLLEQAKNLCESGIGHSLHQCVFTLLVGVDYLTEIAKTRAFKQLWYNLLFEYDLPLEEPTLHVITKAPFEEDAQKNMIASATQAMSAIVGGASLVIVTPSSSENTPFTHRIARNVQHLLREESHLGYVKDIAAGSYYLENLTEALVERVWRKL